MKRPFTIVALAAGLLAGTALAQSPSDGSAQLAQRSIKITAEQGYIIKENVIGSGGTTGQQAPETGVEVGEKAPANIELKDFPPLVVQKVPAVRGHKFFVTANQVVIVSTSDNTIADILK
jgi:hypothetical protein